MRLLAVLISAALLAGCTAAPPTASQQARNLTGPTATSDVKSTRSDVATCEKLPPTAATAATDDALPALTLPCLVPGPDVALGSLSGRPTLINLWATWCAPCREEMPMLQEAYLRHGDAVRFLGVDTKDHADAAVAFLHEVGATYPHVSDPQGLLLADVRVSGLPVTLAVDANGRIVAREIGQLTADELADLLNELTSP